MEQGAPRSRSAADVRQGAFNGRVNSAAGWFEKRQAGEGRQRLLMARGRRVMAYVSRNLHDEDRLSGDMAQAMSAMNRRFVILRVERRSVEIHRHNGGV